MSTPPSTPAGRVGSAQAADAASIRNIQAMFQHKMLDRAVALADARWPGAGEMVKLASEWSSLSPADRRARLSQIGPEDLARLRALADLNPDLARVLDDLEARGVLPPTLYSSPAGKATQEALVDTVLNLSEAAARHASGHLDDPATIATVAAAGAVVSQAIPKFELLPQVEMPSLDLGLPSTDEFLDAETQRRIQATDAAHATLERVHQRADRTAERLLRSSAENPPSARDDSPTIATLPPTPTPTPRLSDEPTGHVPPHSALVSDLLERFEKTRVVVIHEYDQIPTSSDITSTARVLNVPVREFSIKAGEARAVFGGLRRHGPEVRIEVGPLPRALAEDCLVVVRGSIYPKMVARWREGFCDIPGTKSSTRNSPGCRILVLGNAD